MARIITWHKRTNDWLQTAGRDIEPKSADHTVYTLRSGVTISARTLNKLAIAGK